MGFWKRKIKNTDNLEESVVTQQPIIHHRRSRRQPKGVASVEDVLKVVREPIFKNRPMDRDYGTKSIQDEQLSVLYEENSNSGENLVGTEGEETNSVAGSAGVKATKIFTVPVVEEPMKKLAVPENIAKAFGFDSSIGDRASESATESQGVESHSEPIETTGTTENYRDLEQNLSVTEQSTEQLESCIATELVPDSKENIADDTNDGEQQGFSTLVSKEPVSGILKRLTEITSFYRKRRFGSSDVSVLYHDENVERVTEEHGTFYLACNKVYVNGELQEWDDFFEVKVNPGMSVEVETGIGFLIPDNCKLIVSCSKRASEKFYFKQRCQEICSTHSVEPIVFRLEAEEGAYISKVGRLIECQVVVA